MVVNAILLHHLKTTPMTQISTPAPKGPQPETLDFIRKFARNYRPKRAIGKFCILIEDHSKALGEC